jgi:hypothetical protein
VSAPTALDGGALTDGLAWLVPNQAGPRRPSSRTDGPERRNPHPVAVLARAHDDLCTQAADHAEIAAGLEAAGVSDRQARWTYGFASVFELAEAMYHTVPRRPADSRIRPDPWRRPVARHLLRGLLYALPGLLYVLALRSLHAGLDVALLIAATGVGSALGQALALAGHVLIGRGEARAAGTLFRASLLGGCVLTGLLAALPAVRTSVTGLGGGLSPGIGLLAGGQITYLLAATVLLVVGADLLLLAVLAPGVLVSGAVLAGLVHLRGTAVLAVLGVTLATAVVAAGTRLLRRDAPTGRRLRQALGRAELRLCLSYLVYGAANAGLLSFAVVDVLTHGRASATTVGLAIGPLGASLGIADWLVHRLRSRALSMLERTTSADRFRRKARAGFARTLLGYAVALGVLIAVLGAGAAASGVRIGPVLALDSCGYAVLGLAFFLDTVLLSLGRHRTALLVTLVALAADVAVRWAPIARPGGSALAGLHLAVFLTLFLALLPAAGAEYGKVIRHR